MHPGGAHRIGRRAFAALALLVALAALPLGMHARSQSSAIGREATDAYPFGGSMHSVAFDGDVAFGAAGFHAYHLGSSEPILSLESPVSALGASDGRLVVATSAGELCHCPSSSCNRELLTCIDSGHRYEALRTDGGRVLAATRAGTIVLYEVDPRGGLTTITESQVLGQALALSLMGHRAAAGLEMAGDPGHRGAVVLYDLSGDTLTEVSRYRVGSPAVGVGFADDVLLVAEASGAVSAFVSGTEGGSPVDSADLGVELTTLYASGGVVLAGSPRGDVFTFDVSDRTLTVTDHVDTSESIVSVAASGLRAVAGLHTGGWIEFDVESDHTLSESNTNRTVGTAVGLAAFGSDVVVLSPEAQLDHLVFDAEGPTSLATVPLTAPALGAAVTDTAVYAAVGRKGVATIGDSGDGHSEVALLPLPAWASDILTWRDLAYVAAGESGVAVISIDTPNQTSLLGLVDGLGDVRALTRAGVLLAAADIGGSVHLLDLSVSSEPKLVSSLTTGEWPTSLSSDGLSQLFVGTAHGRVQVWDFSTADAPLLTDTIPIGRAIRALAFDADNSSLLVADSERGVTRAHRGESGQWKVVGNLERGTQTLDVVSFGPANLLAEASDGMTVLRRPRGGILVPYAAR